MTYYRDGFSDMERFRSITPRHPPREPDPLQAQGPLSDGSKLESEAQR
jgi:hypothetical protein